MGFVTGLVVGYVAGGLIATAGFFVVWGWHRTPAPGAAIRPDVIRLPEPTRPAKSADEVRGR